MKIIRWPFGRFQDAKGRFDLLGGPPLRLPHYRLRELGFRGDRHETEDEIIRIGVAYRNGNSIQIRLPRVPTPTTAAAIERYAALDEMMVFTAGELAHFDPTSGEPNESP